MKRLFLLLAVALCGCGPRAYLITEQDPSYAPSKSDPVAIIASDTTSIRERQLVLILKHQLVENHFNVVNDPESSMWVVSVQYGTDTRESGSSSRAASIPLAGGIAIGSSKTKINYETDGLLNIWLFREADVKNGSHQAIWSGSASAERETLSEYAPTIIKDLLDAYGKNYEDERLMRFQHHPDP